MSIQTNFTSADMLGSAAKAASAQKVAPKVEKVTPKPKPKFEPVVMAAPVEEEVTQNNEETTFEAPEADSTDDSE